MIARKGGRRGEVRGLLTLTPTLVYTFVYILAG